MCRTNNLKLNPGKCDFFKSEVTFLGHNCTSDGLKPDPKKIATIFNFPTPTNKDEVRRFHAMANYYRRFISDFSGISFPLTNLRKKRVEFKWTDKCEFAFQEIKRRLIANFSIPRFHQTIQSNCRCKPVCLRRSYQPTSLRTRPTNFIHLTNVQERRAK